MAESHDPHDHGGAGSVQPYLVVGLALSVFTAVSFIVNYFVHQKALTELQGFALILTVAVIKASLVAIYFMHLNHDYRKVGFLIVPAIILGMMMMFVLLPDTVQWWQEDPYIVKTTDEPPVKPKEAH